MATVNLVPNADVSNNWSLSSGSDVWALLDEDDTGSPPSDGRHIYTTSTGSSTIVEFQDFDSTGVASIDSVQAVIRANVHERAKTYNLGMYIGNNGSGAASWGIENTGSQNSSASWVTYTFTSRSYSSGSLSEPAWNDTDIDNITMRIDSVLPSGGTLRVTYAYYIITYTATVAVADNATFFGANF